MPILVEIGQEVLEKKIFIKMLLTYFSSVSIFYLPLEMGVDLHWKKLKFHSLKDLYTEFGWNWLSGFAEVDENVKRLQTNDEQQVFRKAHLGFHTTQVT